MSAYIALRQWQMNCCCPPHYWLCKCTLHPHHSGLKKEWSPSVYQWRGWWCGDQMDPEQLHPETTWYQEQALTRSHKRGWDLGQQELWQEKAPECPQLGCLFKREGKQHVKFVCALVSEIKEGRMRARSRVHSSMNFCPPTHFYQRHFTAVWLRWCTGHVVSVKMLGCIMPSLTF